jgi:hypothetical protein
MPPANCAEWRGAGELEIRSQNMPDFWIEIDAAQPSTAASPMSYKVVFLTYAHSIITITLKQLTPFRKRRKVAVWMF